MLRSQSNLHCTWLPPPVCAASRLQSLLQRRILLQQIHLHAWHTAFASPPLISITKGPFPGMYMLACCVAALPECYAGMAKQQPRGM